MYILSFIDEVTKFMKPVRSFIDNNYDNPLFWLAIVVIAITIFGIAYNVLHKGE